MISICRFTKLYHLSQDKVRSLVCTQRKSKGNDMKMQASASSFSHYQGCKEWVKYFLREMCLPGRKTLHSKSDQKTEILSNLHHMNKASLLAPLKLFFLLQWSGWTSHSFLSTVRHLHYHLIYQFA